MNDLGQVMKDGFGYTIVGMLIVFGALIILWGVLELMKVVFYKPDKADSVANEQEDCPKSLPAETGNSEELIAVLTAAVAASLNTSTYNLKIASYRRIANTSPAWNSAGKNDIVNSRI